MGKLLYVDMARGTSKTSVDAGFVLGLIYKETPARAGFEITLAMAGEAARVRAGDWCLAAGRKTRDSEGEH